uniref:Uncharacterized protein n=1 Tax=Fagus sylvatica TaxID=28930 RepID=A0A2N9J5L1_FAGSY
MAQTGISAAVAPAHSKSTITLTTDQLEDIITQALIRAGNASSSSTLSVLPGKLSSWLLDSACCNHMTPYPSFFSHTSSARHAPNIHTANGSTMLVRSIGTVSTSKLSIFDVFHVPQLSYNLLSVGQLAELGYRIILDYYGCVVQDPRTGQELGTGRRIGRCLRFSVFVFLLLVSLLVSLLLPHLHLPYHFGILGSGMHHLPGYNNLSLGAPPSKTEEPKENFDTSLTLFVLSSCLPKFLYPFGEKLFSLLPMPSIVFQAQPFLIRLLMSAFLDLHLSINISDPLALPVSSFFSLMNTTNSSLVLAFVASLVMHRLFTEVSQFSSLFLPLLSLSDLFPEVSTPSPELFPPSPEVSTSIPQTESSDHSSGSSSDETPHSSSESPAPAPSEDPAPATTLHCSSRVTSLPSHLRDFHCYTALATLHEPHSYREASSNPLWQASNELRNLDALSRNQTDPLSDTKLVLLPKVSHKEYGIDYEETFAPVARLSICRTLIGCLQPLVSGQLISDGCQKCHSFNGDLNEEVYMQPPPGLSHLQAFLTRFFQLSSYDSALFLRRTGEGITILLLLYVDDMIITGDDLSGIQELKAFLSQNFEMKDLGHLSYFLGLEITSSDDGFYLTQANLVYLTVTRPDISYAVHQVSQFMSAPRSTHYAAVLRILRYLKGTLFHDLHFSAQSSLTLRAYSDADWAGDPTDRRSTTEAEYRALADTTSELLWLRWLLQDLGVSTSSATPIYCDNRSAIQIARNDVFHERTKHIEIDCHLVRHHLLQGSLQLISVSSHDQLADIFTKSHAYWTFP